jgi:hypothetical protein
VTVFRSSASLTRRSVSSRIACFDIGSLSDIPHPSSYMRPAASATNFLSLFITIGAELASVSFELRMECAAKSCELRNCDAGTCPARRGQPTDAARNMRIYRAG